MNFSHPFTLIINLKISFSWQYQCANWNQHSSREFVQQSSSGNSPHNNSRQKSLDLRPSLERGSCGACCSSVWLMMGFCSLWSMTGPPWTGPIVTTQMWQADRAARHRPRWEQDRWKAILQSVWHKHEPKAAQGFTVLSLTCPCCMLRLLWLA